MSDKTKELLNCLKEELLCLAIEHKELPTDETVIVLKSLGETDFVDKLYNIVEPDDD